MTLIERLASLYPRDALRRLRGRIVSSHPLELFEQTTVRVAAKRWSLASENDGGVPWPPGAQPLGCGAGPERALLVPDDVLEVFGFPCHGADHLGASARPWACGLAAAGATVAERLACLDALVQQGSLLSPGRRERSIAALLVDAKGQVLRLAFNRPDDGHIWHAEYLLLRAQIRHGGIPWGARVLVTRKPCRMCAALVARFVGAGRVVVSYSHDDPGPLAAQTVLDRASPDRRIWNLGLADGLGCGQSGAHDWQEQVKVSLDLA